MTYDLTDALTRGILMILSRVCLRTCPFRGALAVVRINAVHTYPSVHTLVARTIIHVVLTVVSLKA